MTLEERVNAAREKCHEFISQALGLDDDLLLGAQLVAQQILALLDGPEPTGSEQE